MVPEWSIRMDPALTHQLTKEKHEALPSIVIDGWTGMVVLIYNDMVRIFRKYIWYLKCCIPSLSNHPEITRGDIFTRFGLVVYIKYFCNERKIFLIHSCKMR